MKIQYFRQVCAAQTDKRTLLLLGLLTEPKNGQSETGPCDRDGKPVGGTQRDNDLLSYPHSAGCLHLKPQDLITIGEVSQILCQGYKVKKKLHFFLSNPVRGT